MTTVARQLPITLIAVRAMSINSSTPRIRITPSTGSANDASVPSRITSEARGTPATPFDVSISVSSMTICCVHDKLDAGRLCDKDGCECEIQRRAVKVKAVTRRQHKPDDAPRYAKPGEIFHRLRQGGFARRGGERDRRRCFDGIEKILERNFEDQRDRQQDDHRKHDKRAVKRQHELA